MRTCTAAGEQTLTHVQVTVSWSQDLRGHHLPVTTNPGRKCLDSVVPEVQPREVRQPVEEIIGDGAESVSLKVQLLPGRRKAALCQSTTLKERYIPPAFANERLAAAVRRIRRKTILFYPQVTETRKGIDSWAAQHHPGLETPLPCRLPLQEPP